MTIPDPSDLPEGSTLTVYSLDSRRDCGFL